ncbi:MAG: flagellar hook-length control protein FliK [Deltaproteobacteria bacterium]|jgi:hypothetical protein|nr:flagellar hook-length control protein FliK [Deltaproteobacteria bacterium]
MESLQAASQIADYAATAVASAGTRAEANFESGANGDFERMLERAERYRDEMRREWEARDMDAELDRKAEEERAERRREASRADAEAEARRQADEAAEAAKGDGQAGNPYAFGERRVRGKSFAFARIQAETTYPGGFKSRVSGELLLSGSQESGAEGVMFGRGSPAGLLAEALKGLGTNLGLSKLGEGGAEALGNVLLASGLDPSQVSDIKARLFVEGGEAEMNAVLRALAAGMDASLATQGPLGGLTATPDGLNSLGQFLLGLGFSPEAVKSVTAGIEPGSVLPASTLAGLITGGISGEGLAASLTEGDLSYLALALQSMGAGAEAEDGLSLMLEMKGGAVSVGDLLSFLETLEKPTEPSFIQISPKAAAKDIQTVLQNLTQDTDLVKAPVFNEIILKLSALGDRQLDRSFYELSPALQALRGGLGAAAGGEGGRPFENGGGDDRGDRRGREEQRVMAAAASAAGPTAAGGAAAAESGAFAAALSDSDVGRSSRETLVRELRDKLSYSARRGVRRLRMSLSPESLGGLDIELKVKGSKVAANIKADSLEAYRALEAEVRTLREELAAEGLELKLTVSYDGGASGGSEGAFYARDGRRYGMDGGESSWTAEGDGASTDPEEISPADAGAVPEAQGTYAGSLLQAVV